MVVNKNTFMIDFYNNFGHLRETPLVLYGIGQFTRQIVEQAKDFQIVGLMDDKTTGQKIYGLKVMDRQEVAKTAKAVIIVANLSVVKIIYRRIEEFTKENKIKVYYLNGLEPLGYDMSIAKNPYWDKKETDLRSRILENEIISFDIFDTLLVRKCQSPKDIFGMLADETGVGADFTLKREEAEKICYRQVSKYFQIGQIYDVLYDENQQKDFMIRKEIEMEKRFLIPRECMRELLVFAKNQEKTVILTSDMYLPSNILDDILRLNDICGYDRLFVSCDIKKDKYWGNMWAYIRKLYSGRKILHIGDHEISDEKTAKEYGIETYRIAAPNMLLKMSGIDKYLNGGGCGKYDSMLSGLFMVKAFNNPFCMNKYKGKLYISTMYEFGYLFWGPLILNYLLWLVRMAEEQMVNTILFVARDGYLLEKLYRKLVCRNGLEAPHSVYFLSSRRAASIAAIESEEDIWFIFDKLCNTASLKYEKILKRAFGVEADPNDRYREYALYEIEKKELFRHTMKKYGKRIFENALWERKNYTAYIERLQLEGKLGFVNFVCRGTTQYCISKIIKKRMAGFYFASEDEITDIYPHREDIFCCYGENLSIHTSRLHIAAKILFGETILSAPEGGLIYFDEGGTPVYAGKKESFAEIEECHRGIGQYMDDMLDMIPHLKNGMFSNSMIDEMLGIFDTENVVLAKNVQDVFVFEDYYGGE